MNDLEFRMKACGVITRPAQDNMTTEVEDAEWKESDHPRKGGKFAPKGQGEAPSTKPSEPSISSTQLSDLHKGLESMFGKANSEKEAKRFLSMSTKERNQYLSYMKPDMPPELFSKVSSISRQLSAQSAPPKSASTKPKVEKKPAAPKVSPFSEEGYRQQVEKTNAHFDKLISSAKSPEEKSKWEGYRADALKAAEMYKPKKKEGSDSAPDSLSQSLQSLKERVANDGGPGSGRKPEGGSKQEPVSFKPYTSGPNGTRTQEDNEFYQGRKKAAEIASSRALSGDVTHNWAAEQHATAAKFAGTPKEAAYHIQKYKEHAAISASKGKNDLGKPEEDDDLDKPRRVAPSFANFERPVGEAASARYGGLAARVHGGEVKREQLSTYKR